MRRSLLPRILTITAVVVLILAIVAGFVGYLAYGSQPTLSGRVAIAGLEQEVQISFDGAGRPLIRAASPTDALAALGYLHASERGWAMMLWRQVALGDLGAWFGARDRSIDLHARELGIAANSRAAFLSMDDDSRRALVAYAAGVNRAFDSPAVADGDEFALLGVQAAPWEPWHALAVERLLAYLGTADFRAQADTLGATADTNFVAFMEADDAFRSYVHIGDTRSSYAWVGDAQEGRVFLQSHVYGASALPLIYEVAVAIGNTEVILGSVPGTTVFPSGISGTESWALLLTSDLTLESYVGPLPDPAFDRITDRRGNEQQLRILRDSSALFMPATPPPTPILLPPASVGQADTLAVAETAVAADTVAQPAPETRRAWRLVWPGFSPEARPSIWLGALIGSVPEGVGIWRGDGLALSSSGETRVLGAPPVNVTVPGGVFVSSDELKTYAGTRLAGLLSDTVRAPLASIVGDAMSPWAAQVAPPLIDLLSEFEELPATADDVAAYLRSWQFDYEGASVGGSIFDTWIAVHRSATGRDLTTDESVRWPESPADSAAVVAAQRGRTLLRGSFLTAVDTFTARHGTSPADWRWERVYSGERYFPVWQRPDGTTRAGNRHEPAHFEDGGHPTTLLAGPSPAFPDRRGAASWTIWTLLSDQGRAAHTRHGDVLTSGFLARSIRSDERMQTRSLSMDLFEPRLTLSPR
ncbi:penicillin acylase family protein [soil metagenome]